MTDIAARLKSAVPLVFTGYGVKLYARTPGGEYAYGDGQGLYEWRDGRRIHYSGGDRQFSDRKGMHRFGPEAPGRPPGSSPYDRGARAAVMNRARLN